MTIAILATGDELIHGDTLNTNSYEIAQTLSSEGLPLGYQLCCSDKTADIVEGLHFLTQKQNIIILIGGLGPTTDDLTRFATAAFTQQALIQHPQALEHVQKRMQAAHLVLNEGNLQQCLFPQEATLLPNPNGTAMGGYFESNEVTFILLPGPPRECLPMFNDYVLPLLQKKQHSNKVIMKWRVFGVAESDIAQTLEDTLAEVDCQTGYRLDTPYLEFKVRCTADLTETVNTLVTPILSPHIISPVDSKASDQLRQVLMTLKEPVHIIDKATGGLLQSLLTKPDSYGLLHWHETNTQSRFNFKLEGLKEYWLQQPASNGLTQLSISYCHLQQQTCEIHDLPYRSSSVIAAAAEWFCFRVLHIINQLH